MPKNNFPVNSPNSLSESGHLDREMFSFSENPNDSGFDKRTYDLRNELVINFQIGLDLVRSSGLHVGEQYNRITTAAINGSTIIQYDLNDICQFQIELEEVSGQYTIEKRGCEFFLLQENGDLLLQEDGFALKTQGLVP